MRYSKSFKGKNKASYYFAVIILIIALIVSYFIQSNEEKEAKEIPEGNISVSFLDVGQGDCTLITVPDVGYIIVDAGPSDAGDYISEYLKLNGIKTIDYLIITHPHTDHYGGAEDIMDATDVKNVVLSDAESDKSTYNKFLNRVKEEKSVVSYPLPGDKITFGEVYITFFGPLEDYSDDNNFSLVFKLEYGETSFFFAGDMETDAEKDLLDEYKKSELDCDVLKVGHHGSSSSSSDKLLKVITPDVSVICCGQDNDYNHPNEKVVERLKKYGTVYITWQCDGVEMVSDGKTVTVLE